MIAGAWVVCQVFGGNALERLGILKSSTGDGGLIPKPGTLIPGLTPSLPGGRNNPPSIDFGDLFPNTIGKGPVKYL